MYFGLIFADTKVWDNAIGKKPRPKRKIGLCIQPYGPQPWHGPHEKDARFFQFLIEGTTIEGDIVLDCTIGTGKMKTE